MKNVQTAQTQKYKPGQYIVSLDHLMEQERIFFMGKLVKIYGKIFLFQITKFLFQKIYLIL